jgi:hypothetical protein
MLIARQKHLATARGRCPKDTNLPGITRVSFSTNNRLIQQLGMSWKSGEILTFRGARSASRLSRVGSGDGRSIACN